MHRIMLSAATAPRNAAGVRESAGIWPERWRKSGRGRRTTMVRVKDLMTPQAEVISPDGTAEDAASVMKTLDIGVLPVCDEEGLVGILTDRDLVVRVLAAKRDPKAMLVGEAMTPSVVYCFEDDDVERAALVMAGQQIRRLPVLDRNRKLVGIISIGDIAAQGQSQLGGEVLEEVSQPTGPKRSDTPPDHDGGLGQAA